ncbi:MAG: glycine--tRNA ligase [Candidatus Pacebacteria bacterium]|nr:glycine--tRNA ligase [Candidatus Paceibacterota bacterium]
MKKPQKNENLMNKIISFSKRRGFVFLSSEIYGGFGSCYDFGPLGVELKNNIKKSWWQEMTRLKDNIVGLDSAILMSPKIWQASGHLTSGFSDELVECKKCHKRFRLDLIEKDKCPECSGNLTEPKKFNLMMKTYVGPVENEAAVTYLRAETCQGIYMNFKNVVDSMRLKIPFGIAQTGKAFRNEITPKDFIYRTREFEQMEMQWFCHPNEADKYFDYWKKERINWYLKLGIRKENLRTSEVLKKDLAHYAKRAVDIEYKFPFGWREIEGVHNRGDWDLSNHSKHSGQDLTYRDEERDEKYFPNIIETSAGADRLLFAFLCDSYLEIKGGRTKTTKSIKELETVLKINKVLAPIKAAVFPLVRNNSELVEKSKEVYRLLRPRFVSYYDETGSIGKRYRRQDEIGTAFSLTIDFETLKDNTVTIRDRDTMDQKRIKIEDLVSLLEEKLKES